MAIDLTKLVRILRMTESSSDGEALNALRAANAMLKSDGKTWEDVIHWLPRPTLTVSVKERRRGRGDTTRYGAKASQSMPEDNTRHQGSDINVMMGTVSQQKHDVSTLMMVAGMRSDWEKNGYLTGNQYEALRRLYSGAPRRDGWKF